MLKKKIFSILSVIHIFLTEKIGMYFSAFPKIEAFLCENLGLLTENQDLVTSLFMNGKKKWYQVRVNNQIFSLWWLKYILHFKSFCRINSYIPWIWFTLCSRFSWIHLHQFLSQGHWFRFWFTNEWRSSSGIIFRLKKKNSLVLWLLNETF